MDARSLSSPEKLPFDKLVAKAPKDLLRRKLGVQKEGTLKVVFDSSLAKIPSTVKQELQCDSEKLGATLNLRPSRISDLIGAAEGDRRQQIGSILLGWVEDAGDEATVEALLKVLYDVDEAKTVGRVVDELCKLGPDLQRNFPISTQLPMGFSQLNTMEVHNEKVAPALAENMAKLRVDTTKEMQERLEGLSEQTPGDLPPELSLLRPHEETSPAMSMDTQQSSSQEETQRPVEESQLGPSMTHVPTSSTKVPIAFEHAQHVTPVPADSTFDEAQIHEMVSGDRRIDRMQSAIDNLTKEMRRMESEVEDVKVIQKRESLLYSKKTEEWEKRFNELEEENKRLKSDVADLESQLKKVNLELQAALEKVAKLEKDNKVLKDENLRLISEAESMQQDNIKFQQENELLHQKIADMTEEKADMEKKKGQFVERLENENNILKDEKMHYEHELTKKLARIETLEKRLRELEQENTTDGSVENGNRMQGHHGYIWKRQLGAGGFGEVYLAGHVDNTEVYAAKRITFKDSASIEKQREMMESFLKEMKVLQDCNHPRVVRYIDRVIEQNRNTIYFYIVMEYMKQGSLADLLKREGKFEELIARKYTIQLLKGLQYLHRKCIIHRDVKCSNILLDEHGDIKLADFGCVKFSGSSMSSGEHLTGTAWWMAPELVPGGKQSGRATEKSDIWSVGVTVVEMLTGKRPFHDYQEKMSVIFGLGTKGLDLEKLICRPEIPDTTESFLRMCIIWEPSERSEVHKLLSSPFCSL